MSRTQQTSRRLDEVADHARLDGVEDGGDGGCVSETRRVASARRGELCDAGFRRGFFSEDSLEARLNHLAALRGQASSESAVRASLFAACRTLLTVVEGNK